MNNKGRGQYTKDVSRLTYVEAYFSNNPSPETLSKAFFMRQYVKYCDSLGIAASPLS